MDSIVYGNLRIEILAEHGGKIQRATLQAKPSTIHALSHWFVATGPVQLQGRDAEVAAAQAISSGEAIEFSAGCGFGKSTLLRHLAAQAGAEEGAAVVYLRVGSQRATTSSSAWWTRSTPRIPPSSRLLSSVSSCSPGRGRWCCLTT